MKNVLFLLLQFVKFIYKSNNRHGLHSPYVYKINDEILPDVGDYYAFNRIEDRRKMLLSNAQKIKVTDYGAGSHKNNDAYRSINIITKNTSKSPKIGRLLFRLVNYFQPLTVLELGTSTGISTAYIAAAKSDNKIISIEGCENISRVAIENLAALGLDNVEVLQGHFNEKLPVALDKLEKIDFVFIDGHHNYLPTIDYYNQIKLHLNAASVVVLDDIHWSSEMLQAWNELRALPEVSYSIDLFDIGLLLYRPSVKKEHFVLRYDGFFF